MGGRILIVDGIATNRILLRSRLGAAFFQPSQAVDGADCLTQIPLLRPDAVLVDANLPDMTAADLIERLRANPATAALPVIVLAGAQGHAERLASLSAGAEDVLSKPLDFETLLARLRNILRTRAAQAGPAGQEGMTFGLAEAGAEFETPGTIAILTNRADHALVRRLALSRAMSDRIIALTPEQAMSRESGPADRFPDVYLIEADLCGAGGGLGLMSDLRSRAETRHAAICLERNVEMQPAPSIAFDLGANDVVNSQVPTDELALRLHNLLRRKQAADRVRASVNDGLRLALTDALTGLYNRRFGLPRLAAIAAEAEETACPYAVMVVDIDRFKSVNDRFGHAAGDAVLVEVARRLTEGLRISDLLARIGGEEFLIALPDTGLGAAQGIAQRLCDLVQDTRVVLPDGATLTVTISIGLALGTADASGEPATAVLDRADRALLAAKANGRNTVTISQSAA
jgi:two-component system, cell cycle response regulator